MSPLEPAPVLMGVIALVGLTGCAAAWRRPGKLAARLARCSCGYPYAGIAAAKCPECGKPHEETRRAVRADGIFLTLVAWTLSAIAAAWGIAAFLTLATPPVQTLDCSFGAPSKAGNITFNWTVIDAGRFPRVDGLIASSSRPGTPIAALSPRDLDRDGASIAAAMASLVEGAPNATEDERARIAADLTAAATRALKGGLPGPPQDSGGIVLYGSGLSGTGYVGASTPRLAMGASLPFTIPPLLVGGALLIIRLVRVRPVEERGRAPDGARP